MYVTKSKMILRNILTMILPDLYIFSGISWLEGKGRESTGTMAAATRMNVVESLIRTVPHKLELQNLPVSRSSSSIILSMNSYLGYSRTLTVSEPQNVNT